MANSASSNQTESTPGPALEFLLRLALAYATLTRRMDNSLSNLHGLSFGDFMLLYHLQRAPGMRLRRTDLAERVGLTASGVTRSVLPLEKRGLVAREPDPRDARVGYAALTKAGQRLLANALPSAEAISREIAQNAPVDQLASLSSLLGQLAGINFAIR